MTTITDEEWQYLHEGLIVDPDFWTVLSSEFRI